MPPPPKPGPTRSLKDKPPPHPETPGSLFGFQVHPEGLSDQDLETMRYFGVDAALATMRHFPNPTEEKLLEHIEALVVRHLPRLERYGIRAFAALGIHPRAIPRRGVNAVLSAIPGFCRGGKVVAIGEIGLEHGGEVEEEVLAAQLELSRTLNLPVIATTPAADKEKVTRQLLNLLRETELPPAKVLVANAAGKTVKPILACGHWASLSLHPDELRAERAVALIRKLGSERLVLAADVGDRPGDILALPRAVHLLAKARLSTPVMKKVAKENASAFLRIGRG